MGVYYSWKAKANLNLFVNHQLALNMSISIGLLLFTFFFLFAFIILTHVFLFRVLERMRNSASETSTFGPRVMIIGPVDSGKSTLCSFLLNYAVRQQRTPVFVDLDIGQGSIGPPGTLSASVIRKPFDIEV
jgi:pantothenate kinase